MSLSDPLTIKLVIVGDSGCGKTSLRGQYIAGRFSTGYRATIGADFITKSLPNPLDPENRTGVVLQIWDTAGQERFSSLSSAFFRGADAVILMYDVSSPKSLQSLQRWWNEFRERAPVREGEEEDFCCVVVGNKVDIGTVTPNGSDRTQAAGNGDGIAAGKTRAQAKWKVSEAEATSFMELLIPRSASASTSPTDNADNAANSETGPSISFTQAPAASLPAADAKPDADGPSSPPRPRSKSESQSMSIIITDNRHHTPSSLSPPSRGRAHFPAPRRARSRSSTRNGYSVGTKNSLSSAVTRESIYHTPASSFYESARSSPIPFPRDGSSGSPPPDRLGVGLWGSSGRGGRTMSTTSTNSSSALTITQSLFLRTSTSGTAPTEMERNGHAAGPPSPTLPPAERRPKLFFTSAKTGEGVADVFEYVARRVVVKWEWEQRQRDDDGWAAGDGGDTIRIGMRGREGWGMRTA
ncbi:ras-domain-containing protein, partial [Athelia psychrophila]